MLFDVIFKVKLSDEEADYVNSLSGQEREDALAEHTDNIYEFIKSELAINTELVNFEVVYHDEND